MLKCMSSKKKNKTITFYCSPNCLPTLLIIEHCFIFDGESIYCYCMTLNESNENNKQPIRPNNRMHQTSETSLTRDKLAQIHQWSHWPYYTQSVLWWAIAKINKQPIISKVKLYKLYIVEPAKTHPWIHTQTHTCILIDCIHPCCYVVDCLLYINWSIDEQIIKI